MATRVWRVGLAVLGLLLAQHVDAGLLDSPPPTFDGAQGQVIYRMGAIYYDPGRVDTMVTCTNLDTIQARLAIELFDERDNLIGTLAHADLPAGATVTFTTSADMSRQGWVVIPDLPAFDHGKARVSATTTKLSCSGYQRIRTAVGTFEEKALELVKKVSRPTQRR